MNMAGKRTRLCLFCRIVLLAGFAACGVLRPDLIGGGVHAGIAIPIYGAFAYLLLGCVRGFTLVPSTYLLVVAIPFFRPVQLFVLTLIGIAGSSASVYYFSKLWELDRYFEARHGDALARLKHLFQMNQLSVIVGWSFFPLAPTDLICYVSGILRVSFPKFILGILLGEGTICSIYVFFGYHATTYLRQLFA